MCRLLAYLGAPVTLEELVLRPPHSLLHQSYEPREQRHGVVNADGFGVGWYDLDRRPEPARYRSDRPIWADRSFASLAGLVSSTAVLAAVRSATPPAPSEESGVPPFADGRWLFAHNGAVDGFREGVGVRLRRGLSERRDASIEGAADSEVLFAMALDALDRGAPPGDALRAVVETVRGCSSGGLNLVLTDGRAVTATACGESLFVLADGTRVIVASEPFDDDAGWRRAADGTLVEASPDGVRETSL